MLFLMLMVGYLFVTFEASWGWWLALAITAAITMAIKVQDEARNAKRLKTLEKKLDLIYGRLFEKELKGKGE